LYKVQSGEHKAQALHVNMRAVYRYFSRVALCLVFTLALLWPARITTAKKTLRVLTYNIHVGVGIDKKLDLQRIADVINHERPDLVGLQEVDRNVKRTEGKDASARFVENVVDPLHRLIGRWLRS
jgi:hypothetical protein